MKKISPGEYDLVVYTTAHAISGGQKPNEESLRAAKNIVDAGLRSENVEMGSLWGRVKKAAKVALPFLPVANQTQIAIKATKAIAAADKKRKKQNVSTPAPSASEFDLEPDIQTVSGTHYQWITVGEEERELASSGGMSEREALARRTMRAKSVPDLIYKAAVLQMARKISGQKFPDARSMAKAKMLTDARLASQGANVTIPGARPGRRTV